MQALVNHVSHGNVGQPQCPGHLHQGQADHPGAVDQQAVAGVRLHAIQHVKGNGVRFHQRGMAQRHSVRQAINIARRHADLLTETTVTVHTDHLQLGAHIGPIDAARVAGTAADHRVDAHTVADLDLRNVSTHFADHSGKLMAGNPREAHKGVLPVNDVQVRTADSGISDVDPDFTARQLRDIDLGQAEFKGSSYLKRFHRVTPART